MREILRLNVDGMLPLVVAEDEAGAGGQIQVGDETRPLGDDEALALGAMLTMWARRRFRGPGSDGRDEGTVFRDALVRAVAERAQMDAAVASARRDAAEADAAYQKLVAALAPFKVEGDKEDAAILRRVLSGSKAAERKRDAALTAFTRYEAALTSARKAKHNFEAWDEEQWGPIEAARKDLLDALAGTAPGPEAG